MLSEHRPHRWLRVVAAIIFVIVIVLLIANPILSRWARGRILQAVQENYDVEIQKLNVNLFPTVRVTGEGVAFRSKGRTDVPPLFTIARFSADAGWIGLLTRRVSLVRLEGLNIQVPPRRGDEHHPGNRKSPAYDIGEIVADGTVLTILPKAAGKDPLEFDIYKLSLRGASSEEPMSFRAILKNAKPPGEIHSSGKFGPWQMDDPAATAVSGDYTFDNADLGVFKGIGGTLSSTGRYEGVLDHINVEGHTDVPNFVVKVAGHPVHLITDYKAVVDGMDGDTMLDPVNAQFGKSAVTARGAVDNKPGVKGKTTSLDVTVTNGRLQDMLDLAVKGDPMMNGAVSFRTKMVIPPGDIDIADKLQLDGGFEIGSAKFSELNIQEKVDKLSQRGRGDIKDPEGDTTVASNFTGKFVLRSGTVNLSKLSFDVPGVRVSLNGTYGLVDERLDFQGTATMTAKLSQMTTGIKSFLLKALDPFFEKKNAGAVIPIKIGGTRASPTFGLSFQRGAKAGQPAR